MGSSINLQAVARLLDPADADFHRQTIADLLHRHVLTFPGAQPVSFARHHLQQLQQHDYFMCEKTDGIRCLLFLTQIFIDGEPREAQFLIDRKNDYYYIPGDSIHIPMPDDLFKYHGPTLLDGELVRQTFKDGSERLAYLIFDLLAIDNEDVTSKQFDKRLARVQDRVIKPYRNFAKQYPDDVAHQPFQIEMKKMEFSYGMEMMFRDKIPNLPHGNDGLIFTRTGTPYMSGTDQNILKWKPPHENTIDFRLIIGEFPVLEDDDGQYEDYDAKPEVYLYVNEGGRTGYSEYATLGLTDNEWACIKRLHQAIDGRIVECFRDPVTKSWRPKIEKDGSPRFRDDKTDGNHISVVNSVIESIEDAVTERDLIDAAGDIKRGVKHRQAVQKEEDRKIAEAEKRRRVEEDAKRKEGETERNAIEEVDDGPTYED